MKCIELKIDLRPKCNKVKVHRHHIHDPISKTNFTDIDKFSSTNGIFDMNRLKITIKESEETKKIRLRSASLGQHLPWDLMQKSTDENDGDANFGVFHGAPIPGCIGMADIDPPLQS